MPHSSGGDSGCGGSDCGSYGDVGGYGNYGGRGFHVSNYAFPGSQKYVYYKNNKPIYVYSRTNPGVSTRTKARYLILLIYLPFLFAVYSMLSSCFSTVKKLPADYDTSIVINDTIDVLDNEDELEKVIKDFYDITGITISVMTFDNISWSQNYSTMDNFAYDVYVNSFDDESHWLIVYTADSTDDSRYDDWNFKSMQGNDTDPILKEKLMNGFIVSLNKYLAQHTKYTTQEAIIQAINDITPGIMESEFSWPTIFMALGVLAFLCFHAFFMVFYDPSKKYRGATLCTTNAVELLCSFCGNTFMGSEGTNCPNCGTPAHSVYFTQPQDPSFGMPAGQDMYYHSTTGNSNNNNGSGMY